MQRSGNLLQEQHKVPTNVKPTNVSQQSQAEAALQARLTGQAVWQNNVESQSLLLSDLREPTAVAGRERQAAGQQLRNLGFDANSRKFAQPCDTGCSLPYHSHQTGQEAALPTRYRGGSGQG